MRSAAVQRLAHQTHTPVIASAKENLAAVWRPDRSQFGLPSPYVGQAEDSALTRQVHHPDCGQDGVRVIVSVQSHVPLVRGKSEGQAVVLGSDRCQQLPLPIKPAELLMFGSLVKQHAFARN